MTISELDLVELLDALYDELEPDGKINKIRELIAVGCDVNDGMPLLVAVNTGRLEVVKVLVEAGADVNQVDPEDFETALFRAKYRGFQEISDYLEPLTDPKIRGMVEEMVRQNQPKKSRKQS